MNNGQPETGMDAQIVSNGRMSSLHSIEKKEKKKQVWSQAATLVRKPNSKCVLCPVILSFAVTQHFME